MRRPPEVGQAGLLVILLLGASGCAGFPQRTFGTAPGSAPTDGRSVSPPGLFSWWHRSSLQNTGDETASAGQPETAEPEQRYHLANQPSTSPWPETQAEWVARNFPRFNRLWNGSSTERVRERGEPGDDLATNRDSLSQPSGDTSVTASAPRSDRAVRPTEGPSGNDGGSSVDRSRQRVQNLDDLPFSPTPPPVKSPRPRSAVLAGENSTVNDDHNVPIPADVTMRLERIEQGLKREERRAF